jgi:N-acetyl-gamma-glutamyl-phosphate reductase
MSRTIFIDGAAGTTGLEIADRLAGRSEFTLLVLEGDARKNDAARADALNAADFVILCLPDDAAIDAVSMVHSPRTRIIDASSAHRVSPGWTYGFPEVIGRDAVAGASRVSNPGCYPTGFIALIAPLTRAGLLPTAWPYSCNAVSGYSGGGKALIRRFEDDGEIAFRAYGMGLNHKHVPEMQAYCGLAIAPVFAPAVVAAHRGMIVEVPLPLSIIPGAPGADILRECLAEFYADSALITVHPGQPDELLLRRTQRPSDRMELYVCASADGSQARLVAMLDNLGKGASGAAVQSLNLMAGLPEMAGLAL